jgi:UDP-glucose 4-epimerase
VIHFAGLKAVDESVEQPLKYYRNNLLSTIALCEVMRESGVKRLVFSSSATVYGDPKQVPITEDAPLSPTNPYGQTKAMCEQILRDMVVANPDWSVVLLRYFNPVGAHVSGLIGEDPQGIPNNLLPFVAQVAVGRLPELAVFGDDYDTADGTGVRDYLHVVDLARAHVKALEYQQKHQGTGTFNLGTGQGYSVLDMIKAFEKASGKHIPYRVTARRPGDIASCYADPALAKRELGWKVEKGFDDMCADAWRWQSANPQGYSE